MEYRYLGKSGLQVSALSLGAWVTMGGQIDEKTSFECMQIAIDAGVNFFDNAEVYSHGNAEIVMGNVIKKSGWKRLYNSDTFSSPWEFCPAFCALLSSGSMRGL